MLGRKGSNHPAFKGNPFIADKDGYLRLYAPDHPWPRRGMIPEHVRVMELCIGRRIRPDECVHHKDHDRQNNSLANLERMTRGFHSSLHRREDVSRRNRDASGRFA